MVGPLLRVLHGLVREVRRCRLSGFAPFFILTIQLQSQATARLREHFSQPMLVEPIPASRSGSFQENGGRDIELEELRRRQS